MGWAEGYETKKQGLQGLTSSLMDTAMQKKEEESSNMTGIFKIIGGAALMMFGNPLGSTLVGSGLSDF